MAPPKDIARSYPKRALTADLGFRNEATFCSDGAIEFVGYASGGPFINYSLNKTFSAFTVASWVLMDGTNYYNYFMGAGGSGSFGGLVHFGWIGGNTTPQLRLQDGKRSIAYIPSQTFPEVVGQWCHVACTINSAGDSIKMYVNGVEATGLTQPTSGNEIEMPGSDGSNAGHFQIGSFQFSSTSQVLGLGGKMANFGLYDAELTRDQIVRLMRGNDFATCSAVATPSVFFELFENNTESTGNVGTILNTGTPYFGYAYAQLPRGLDLTRGAAQAKVHTGRAVDFDGSADRITAAHYNPSGDFLTTTAWVNADSLRAQGLIHNGNLGRNSFLFYMGSSSGNLLFYWNDTTGDAAITHQTNLVAGQWYHLAAVMDMSDPADHQVTWYIDGVAATGTRTSSSWVGDNSYQFGNQYASAGWFDGKIVDCRIYDAALTQAQILQLYHNPEQILPTGVSASNLRRYYPLCDYNDTGGTGGRYFQDMGSDGEPAEDKGSASMAFAQSVPCPQLGLTQSATRLHHPGASQGAAATITAPGTTVSLSAWIFWDQSRVSYPIALGTVTTTTNSFNIRIDVSGNVTLYQNVPYLSGLTITEGGWNHIVFTTRSDSPYWRCWLNNSEASSPAVANVTNITSTDCRLGMNSSSFGMGGFANDAAVWNTELGDSDVAALYNSGVQGMDVGTVQASNLKGWWKFDDLSILKDFSGNGANATVTGTFAAASFPENASGSTIVGDFSMKRKGVSVLNPTGTPASSLVQSAIVSNDGSLSPDPSKGGYSFSTFIRFEQASGSSPWFPMVFSGTNYLTASKRFILNFGDNSVAANAPGISISDGSSSRDYNWPSVLSNPEEWHQLAFTIDYSTSPNTTFKLYLDGALVSTQATHVHSAFDPGDIIVGSYTSANGNFPGAIACFKMYQTKLSDNEIKQVYNSDLRLIKGLQNE